MINQYSPSCSCVCNYPVQEEEPACGTLHRTNLDSLLHIIEQNKHHRCSRIASDTAERSPMIDDANCILRCEKWSLKICSEFKSMVNQSLISFANKLTELNCGSVYEKTLFLNQISQFISTYPFKGVERLINYFIRKNVEEVVSYHAEEVIESIIYTTYSRSYNILREEVIKKAEEAICKESNILELTLSISDKISKFHSSKHIESELKIHFDIKKEPFATLTDVYNNHLVENYPHLMSRSIEIFSGLTQDKECLLSFVFDTFLGNMVHHSAARELCLIFSGLESVSTLKRLLSSGKIKVYTNDVGTEAEGSHRYSDELTQFLLHSENELKEKVGKFILKNEVIVIDGDIVTTCNKEFMEKIVDSSIKYLKSELEKVVLYRS